MHQVGHYGVSLLVFAPIGLALVLAGVPELATLGGATMVALATLPDVDHRVPLVDHRGPTHTVAFALLVGAGTGVAGAALATDVSPLGSVATGVFGFAIGTLGVLAHLLGDVLTPMGISPFWPLSRRHYSLNVTTAKNPIANYLLFALGAGATAGALYLATLLA